MSGDKRARLKQWLESGEARLQPLTFPQRELWEACPYPVADPSQHICCLIHVKGLITPDDCRAAVQRVVDRQEVLRLSFLPGKEGPLQMIRRTHEANIEIRELSGSEGDQEGVEALARETFLRPFDLLQGPLFRVEVLRRAADDHVFVLAIHHAIADGWSLGVFVQDLGGAYMQGMLGLQEALPPPPLSYTAWGAAERAYWQPAELEKRAAYWKTALDGIQRLWAPPEEALPASGALERTVSRIPESLTKELKELARRTGATLFSTLLAGFQVMLAQRTGIRDIVVGTPVANRAKQAVRETMGYCSGIVPLRGVVDLDRSFVESVKSVHHNTVESFAEAMPFAELVRALGVKVQPGVNPIYDVRFALQNHPVPDVAVPNLSAKLRMRSTGTPRCHLGCEITEDGDALEVVWLSRPHLFSVSEITLMDQLFQNVLSNACREPQTRTGTIAR